MEGPVEFLSRIQEAARRALELLEEPRAADGLGALELGVELGVPRSLLFLALGALVRDGHVEIVPQGLNYRIRKHGDPTLPEPRAQA